jgi:hypothetical protein
MRDGMGMQIPGGEGMRETKRREIGGNLGEKRLAGAGSRICQPWAFGGLPAPQLQIVPAFSARGDVRMRVRPL